jgi:hypothetical protein
MKVKYAPWIVISLVAVATASRAAVETPVWDTASKSWWAHVQFLAGDTLEGRETGSHGFDLAAGYVEDQFKQAGLKPAGSDGFLQSIAFHVTQPDPAQSSCELVSGRESIPVEIGKEAAINIRGVDGGPLEAPVVFVGYGFAVPERGFDEFSGARPAGEDRGGYAFQEKSRVGKVRQE